MMINSKGAVEGFSELELRSHFTHDCEYLSKANSVESGQEREKGSF